MLQQNLSSSIAPLEPPMYLTPECLYNLTIKASAANEQAFGIRNKPSIFTQALINGLRGQAANNNNDVWTVSTGDLSAHLGTLIRSVDPSQDYPQRCIRTISDTTDIIRLPGPPKVHMSITCDPDAALRQAALSCRHVEKEPCIRRDPPEDIPWEIDVEAGIYEVGASFMDGRFSNVKKSRSAIPPVTKTILNCQ
jgi:hypothetical protein